MPRFVLLEHDHPHLHLDLMLERDGVLLTWRILDLPGSAGPFQAERIGDHRLLYLDYEGIVSGDRGRVRRIAGGELIWIESGADRIVVEIPEGIFCGRLEGVRQQVTSWRFCRG